MFKKILCATDLNVASSAAVIRAVQLAHQYDSQIIMLNVQKIHLQLFFQQVKETFLQKRED